ncbi:uncharacterized protein [Procambarus clarkii]|uniref:uncharacterized protein n=1 Tax=Procambarus clarkii TaxID=6728 RepID=UPI00374294F7
MEGPHPRLILQLVFLLVLLGAHCTLSRRENRQQDGENYIENQRRSFESPVKEWKNKRGGKGDSETETQPLSVHRRRNWDDGRAQQLEAHAGKPPTPDSLGKRERNTKARETIQNTKENAREKNIAFMGGETQSKRNANVKKINGGNSPGSEARRRNTKVHKTKSQTYKVRKRLEDDDNRNKKLRKKKFPKKAESEKNYYKKHRTGDSRRSKSTNTLKNVQKNGKKTNKKTRNKNTFDKEEERKNRVHRTGGKTAYAHGSKEVEDIARTEKQAKGEPRSEEESPERKQRKNKKKNNSRKIANNRRKAGKWGRKKHPNQKTRSHLKDHINKIKSQTKKWMTRRKSKSRTDAAASGRHRQTDIQAKNIGNYQNQTLKQTRTLITDRKHQERPRGQTRGFDYPMYRLSTCKMTHTLTANEPFLLTSDSSRFARSCFNTFKGPPGSRLTFSCPVFALGSKGCKAERIQIKEPGKKWKFCKTEVVFLESLGDTLTVQHRRKNLAKKDCPGVFVCEVAVAKGTGNSTLVGSGILPVLPVIGGTPTGPSGGQIGVPAPIALPNPIGLPAPIAPPKPIGGPAPIAPPKPIGGPTPIAPPKPIGLPAPIAPPKPIGGPTPIAPPKPIGGPAPIAPPKPIGGPVPIAPPKPIGLPAPIAPPKPIGGPVPIAPPKPIGGPTPIAPPKPIGGPAPIAPPKPIGGPVPIAPPKPIGGPAPIAPPKPIGGPAPIAPPKPIGGPTPIAPPKPIGGPAPIAPPKPIGGPAPIAPPKPIGGPAPIAPPNPPPGGQGPSPPRLFCSKCTPGHITVSRIVGGEPASVGEMPWQAKLIVSGVMCSGTLIMPSWVITAAHCYRNGYRDTDVTLGEHDLDVEEPGSVVLKINKVIPHPKFDSFTMEHDIALVELKSPVTFSDRIMPICLAQSQDFGDFGTAIASGWGHNSYGGSSPQVLHKVTLDIISNKACDDLYGGLYDIFDTMMCTYTENKDACQGDSGGPLVVQAPDGQWVLAGITSFGYRCAHKDSPGIFTRISKYHDWISANTYQENC